MKKHTLALGLMATLGFSTTALAAGAAQSIHVYKSPTCGCCTDWVDHLKENGFEVETTNSNDMGKIKALVREEFGDVLDGPTLKSIILSNFN